MTNHTQSAQTDIKNNIYYNITTATHSRGNQPVSSGSASPFFSFFKIITVKHGGIKVFFDSSNTCEVNENDIIIISPKTPYQTVPTEGTDGILERTVSFSPLLFYPADSSISDIDRYISAQTSSTPFLLIKNNSREHEELYELLLNIYKEARQAKEAFDLSVRAYLSLIYVYIIRRFRKDTARPSAPPKEDAHRETVQKAIEYISKNYRLPISMQQVADECGANYYHFSRLFHQYTGRKFSEYLFMLRMSHAKNLLISTSMPITDVAIDSGFETVSYFIKQFQKETGMTPKKFRTAHFASSTAESLPKK